MQNLKILKLIEELRAELKELLKKADLGDPEVLEKSRELDRFLNEYDKLMQKRS